MNVSRETRARLAIFEKEFLQWNARTNLVSRSQPGDLLQRHIEDSLQLLSHAPSMGDWVDIGTGGGFPGAVLAAVFAETGRSLTLVESNAKKAAFLRTVSVAMNVRATIRHERVERIVTEIDSPDIVSARAVAALGTLFDLLAPWLQTGSLGVFPKGRTANDEIAEARRRWDFDVEAVPSRTADDASILLVRDLRPLVEPSSDG